MHAVSYAFGSIPALLPVYIRMPVCIAACLAAMQANGNRMASENDGTKDMKEIKWDWLPLLNIWG